MKRELLRDQGKDAFYRNTGVVERENKLGRETGGKVKCSEKVVSSIEKVKHISKKSKEYWKLSCTKKNGAQDGKYKWRCLKERN